MKFTPEQLSCENQFLVACCRPAQDEPTTPEIRERLQRQIDLDTVRHLALVHGVMPLFYTRLGEFASEASDSSVWAQLEDDFYANTSSNLFLASELLELQTLFQAHQIPVIAYKGPALAVSAYRNLALREFTDLDIFVPEQDVFRAKDLLTARGYEMTKPRNTLSSKELKAFVYYHHHFELYKPGEHPVSVELHWRFRGRQSLFLPDLDGIWERKIPVTLAGHTVHTLAPEDMLLVLTLHGFGHSWERLKLVCDVAYLIHNHPQLNWDVVLRQAKQLRVERRFRLGILLAHSILDVPLPPNVLTQIDLDPQVSELADWVIRALFANPADKPGQIEKTLFHVRGRESWMEQFYYGLRLPITNSVNDLALRLPPPLAFLCYLVLPFRAVALYGPQLRVLTHERVRRRLSLNH